MTAHSVRPCGTPYQIPLSAPSTEMGCNAEDLSTLHYCLIDVMRRRMWTIMMIIIRDGGGDGDAEEDEGEKKEGI